MSRLLHVYMLLLMVSGACQAQSSRPTDLDSRDLIYSTGFVRPHWTADSKAFWYESFAPNWTRRFIWVDATTGTKTEAFNANKVCLALRQAQFLFTDPDSLELTDLEKIDDTHLRLDIAGCRFVYNLRNDSITCTGRLESVPHQLFPLLYQTLRHDTLERTCVTFVNNTSEDLNIWSIDNLGKLTKLKSIDFWTEVDCSVDSDFEVRGAKGEYYGTYRSVPFPSQVVIRDEDIIQEGAAVLSLSPDKRFRCQAQQGKIELLDRVRRIATTLGKDDGDCGDANPASWSSDSKVMLVDRPTSSATQTVLVEGSPPNQLNSRYQLQTYPKQTDALFGSSIRIYRVDGSEISFDRSVLPDQYYAYELTWDSAQNRFMFCCLDRSCQEVRLISVDLQGHSQILLKERNAKFLDADIAGKYRFTLVPWLDGFLWTSERDGWNHIYLYLADGTFKNQLTHGEWVVREIISANQADRQIIFGAGGIVPHEDPCDVHVCKINLDGTGFQDLTPSDGTHEVSFSPDWKTYLDTYSSPDQPPKTELRQMPEGKLIQTTDQAEIGPLVATGWRPPERFVAKGADGKTDIYGLIHRPKRFNDKQEYPVLEVVYADPAGGAVPKNFLCDTFATGLAATDFIVVQVDGMGTNFRGKAFQEPCWRNIAEAGFTDRIAWIKAAAAEHHEMDLNRVGIYGASLGGEAAVRALESHADFYKAAVAECGSYDDRYWRESRRWMNWPIGPWYAETSDIENAGKLRGKLMLMYEELDTVVDPASTFHLIAALEKNDKPFDLVVIPGADHSQHGDYGDRRIHEFFKRSISNLSY